MTSGEPNLPVPMNNREVNASPAITSLDKAFILPTPHKMNDLESILVAESHIGKTTSLEDFAVVLDRDMGAWFADVIEQSEQSKARVDLETASVDDDLHVIVLRSPKWRLK
jgi:hypothetical protein